MIIMAAFFAASCNNSDQRAAVKRKPVQEVATPVHSTADVDMVEQLFQNDNWLVTDGKDSSYLYCSRLGKDYVKTYCYRMYKGDSVNTIIDTIKFRGDAITWQLPPGNLPVRLKTASLNALEFTDSTGRAVYTIKKIDSLHMAILLPGGNSKKLFKTAPLSTFLVRSRYDYIHGTKLAFSTEK